MLAEIYLLRLQTTLRNAPASPTTTASTSRFVPISLPRT
jgi:hypothetical protein